MTTKVSSVIAALKRWRAFEECLLHSVRSDDGLFSLDLTFEFVWADDHSYEVRPDTDDPVLVTLRLTAIESISFHGGLTDAMRAEPDLVNWGISEVALVEVRDLDPFVGVAAIWESGRRLDIVCGSVQLIEPQAPPQDA